MKTAKSRQQTLVKFLENVCTVDKEDQTCFSPNKDIVKYGTTNETDPARYSYQNKVLKVKMGSMIRD